MKKKEAKMKKMVMIFLLIALIGAFAVLQTPVAQTKSKGDLVLTSKKVGSAPEDAGSAVWNQAEEAKMILTGAGKFEGKEIELRTKSVYTKDEILFRFEWPDKDKSMQKNAWRFSGGKFNKIKANEDRLGLVFEINRIDKFATKGCAVLCHSESKNEKDWYYAASSEKEKADMWHWKSVRSNPVGYAEDGYVAFNATKEPEKGRKRDAGSGSKAKSNRTKDKSGPAYKDIAGFKDGDEIPGYMLNTGWKDSFADVKAKGVWQNGKWTVVMSRRLATGYDDDAQFNTRKRYPFSLAVFDNSGEHDSYNAEPLKLQFK
jgi:hypothetical protein